jgi:hypothetical protein
MRPSKEHNEQQQHEEIIGQCPEPAPDPELLQVIQVEPGLMNGF